MRVEHGAHWASDRMAWLHRVRSAAPVLLAVVVALATQIVPGVAAVPTARADSKPVPKAVFIVGPTSGLTKSNLVDGEKMAEQAEAAGMEVHRVFFPHATWDNVLANIQGANLVVYMGHGYGWPSKYTKVITEARQDGMGLNSFDGSGATQYTYYGANKLRESIHLAPNAIVYLNHLCYASGNAEPGMTIPNADLARQRTDNMANGWLAVGARVVFAYGWTQRFDYPAALMRSDATMDDLFMTPAPGSAKGSPAGYTGWNESRFDSSRTPGTTLHLDPHKKYGYYRSVAGDLTMTTADFRSSATGTSGGGDGGGGGGGGNPPQITALTAADGPDQSQGQGIEAGQPISFHPNGDGIDETLILTHTVTRQATLDATVTNGAGKVVRTYSVNSAKGTSKSKWDGTGNSGKVVPDGLYTLTYVAHDEAGGSGSPVSIDVLVLTAIKLAEPSKAAFFARDGDSLSGSVELSVTVTQASTVSWQIVNADGRVVRTVRVVGHAAPGQLKFTWDGRTDAHAWAPDGNYRSVVTASTDQGTYEQSRTITASAFRIDPSSSAPTRGGTLTLTIRSTEKLSRKPTVTISQPGLADWSATAKHISGQKYKVTLKLLGGGKAGKVRLVISGTDSKGGTQGTGLSLPLS